MREPIQVLYIDHSQLYANLLAAGLSAYHIEVLHLDADDEWAIDEISRSRCKDALAILLGTQIGDLTGLQVARRLRAAGDSRPIFMVTDDEIPGGSELMAIQAMVFLRPFDFDQISEMIHKLAAHH